MQDLVSVITLTHNKLACTQRCLPSLLHTDGTPWELIVVDNGSTDGTRDWLEAFRERAAAAAAAADVEVRPVFNDVNTGCSTARNQGAAAARGAWLAFVDNDVALRTRDWLARLRGVLREDPRAGIVAPKLVYPVAPYRIQCAGAAVSPGGRIQFMGRGEAREDPRFNRRRDCQCLISACFMLPRAVFEQAGGFDEAFNPVEYEDLDLCYRVREFGHRALVEPAVEMYHFESVTTAGTPALPNTRLIIEHGLLFKRRWRHRFSRENGPPDSETAWRKLPPVDLEAVGSLPLLG